MLMFSSIGVVADHRAVHLKQQILTIAAKRWPDVLWRDYGCAADSGRVDLIDYVVPAVKAVQAGDVDALLLLCRSGQSGAIIANRFPHMRAVQAQTVAEVELARLDADANALSLGIDFVDEAKLLDMLAVFLSTAALADRYAARREKLANLQVT